LAVALAAARVNEEEEVTDPISIVAGENEHVRFAGRELQERLTVPLIVADWEAVTVTCAGLLPLTVTALG